jgi:OHCU decarboxylase
MDQPLERLNGLSAEQAEAEFLKCCGSRAWAEAMAQARPFETTQTLLACADAVFDRLSDDDWLEAFRAHPKIGERKPAGAQSETAQRWSAQEQSRTGEAPASVMDQLADANREYDQRFGFIFIVCATGKTAEEMLMLLKSRISNPPATELRIAANEQKKITQLRLRKLLEPS